MADCDDCPAICIERGGDGEILRENLVITRRAAMEDVM
jgi:hypothetical protein